jgi:hypothetical protein
MQSKQVAARHSALDAESHKFNHLHIRGLRVMPAMTYWRNLPKVHKRFMKITRSY